MGGLHSEWVDCAFCAFVTWTSPGPQGLDMLDRNQAQSMVVHGLRGCPLDCASCSPDKSWTAATRTPWTAQLCRVALCFVRLHDFLAELARTMDCNLEPWTATRSSPWLSVDCAGVLWTAPPAVQTKVGLQQLGHHGLHNFAELPSCRVACRVGSNHGLQLW